MKENGKEGKRWEIKALGKKATRKENKERKEDSEKKK